MWVSVAVEFPEDSDVQDESKKKVTPRYLNSLAMYKRVLLTSRGDEGRVGVGFLEKSK